MFSNRYIFIYSSAMVIIVAVALTLVAVVLKPNQDYNRKVEKMQNILKSVYIESTPKNAEVLYKKYIKQTMVVDNKGNTKEGINAFDVDLQIENKKKSEDKNLAVFLFTGDNNEKYYILPVRGKGLWGPIWGYVSFKEDLNTIKGTVFDHKSETPGLGAEIDTREFQDQFQNKTIFGDTGNFVSIKVVKGGALDSDIHGVDAISGGTITSKALEKMLDSCLVQYKIYYIQNRK